MVLEAVAAKFKHTLKISEGLLGGIAIHKTGSPFPAETKEMALAADATLMGAVGLPEFDNAPPSQRPGSRTAGDSRGAGRVRRTCGPCERIRR